jgi:SAM-dependent methyltransferase
MSERTTAAAPATSADEAPGARSVWARGDYHSFAKATVWGVGPQLVAACRIGPGQRVLDVAAGTGNVAIRAAAQGARVVAADLTPENFAAGRAEARRHDVEVDWVEADAEALPFGDGEFDVVTSCFGAIFAGDHHAVAAELVRVCRPGGTIGLTAFTPDGLAGEFFGLFDGYAPPPAPGALPPLLWGSELHAEALLADRVSVLALHRRRYVERSPGGPAAYADLFKRTFGPVVALRADLAPEPARLAAFDAALADFAARANTGRAGGAAEYPYDYLLIVARK